MSFFKAYDMRGTFGTDFGPDDVYRAALALPEVVGGTRWLVGRDARNSSPAVRDALVAGLRNAGAEIDDLGPCTTPMVYFFTAADGYDASAMVTASHNPPGDNGIKVSTRGAMPVGFASGLNRVEKRVAGLRNVRAPAGCGAPDAKREDEAFRKEHIERYAAWHEKTVPSRSFASLRFAVDCSCGMASLFAERLFPGAAILNGTADGNFPAHSPNPLNPEARKPLADFVRRNELDCGVIFDGDADRAAFVDGDGNFVQPDFLIPCIAAECDAKSGDKVLCDVRTGRAVLEALRAAGCEPVATPVGHAFAKPAMRRNNAVCGGELAGHYYFRDFFFCDSGLLAARRILCAAAKAKAAGRSFRDMVAPVAGKYANSGELNLRVDDKDAAAKRIVAAAERVLPPERSKLEIDGVRVDYAEGWFCVRKSNTEPFLRLIAECDTAERLAEWTALLQDAALGG